MLSILAVVRCLVVLSSIGSVKSSLTVQRSSVVIIGERVELKCSVTGNNVALWKYTSWNSSTETKIYLGKDDIVTSMRSRYKIDKNIRGQRNIIIDSVDLAHAGRYGCAGFQHSLINDVQLTVLGSHPVCSGNTSETDVATKEQRRHYLSIWCGISYTGNAIPVFNWTKSNAEKNIHLAANMTTSSSGGGPFTSTSLITQQLQANDSGVTFHCLITIQTPNISSENGSNGFEYTWNYTLYGPRNISIFGYEDRLECSADGNPTPIYRWTDIEANISTYGSVYRPTLPLTNDNEHTLYCTTENIFSSVSNNYTIKGRAKDYGVTSEVSNSLIDLRNLAIAGSLLVLLIITIALACIVHRRRPKGDSSVRPDVALNTDLSSHGYDGRTISENAVYAEVCKPTGPTSGCKGRSIGDNSPSPQIPNRERKDLIEDDGTEYVNMSVVKSADSKGERHAPEPPAFSQETIYTSIDHIEKVPAPPRLPKW